MESPGTDCCHELLSEGMSGLADDLLHLLSDRQTADVICLVGENEAPFYVHKLILWARCNVFKRYKQQFWQSHPPQGPLTFKYPQYKPHVFATVLKYIYTGVLEFEEPSVFSALVMAHDLGIEELVRQCESYASSRLNDDNVCLFLTAALHLQQDQPSSVDDDGGDLLGKCYNYISKHAAGCVASTGWLQLPKQAVISLVSSQQFALEEDLVWKAVFSWAKFNADLPASSKPADWSQQERMTIAECLSGITEHIKLLLIDSSVFAEEVEPCGVVPMEISLERYRLAALTDKCYDSDVTDARLTPRIIQSFFHDTRILTNDRLRFQQLLNQWFGKSKQEWRLLFRASKHAFSAAAFHERCDGNSPTITIIKGTGSSVCGGFSDVPWTSETPANGRYLPSHRAFLFTLINRQGVPPTKFDVVNSSVATLHHPSYGPSFGAGADLCVTDLCDVSMDSYSNLPHSFDGPHASSSILMGDYNFSVEEYEVFTTT